MQKIDALHQPSGDVTVLMAKIWGCYVDFTQFSENVAFLSRIF